MAVVVRTGIQLESPDLKKVLEGHEDEVRKAEEKLLSARKAAGK